MKKAYKIAILFALAVLVTVISIYWTRNVILCVPALVFFSLYLFKSNEQSKCKSVDLHLISLSISSVILVLQVLVMLNKNAFTCNLTALIMSVLNTVILFSLWARNQSQNSQK